MMEDLRNVMKTEIAVSTFFSNFHFLLFKKSYFGSDLITNPLLHLWSLSVEEQFYFIWPIFLFVIINRYKYHSLKLIIGFTFISFLFNIYWSFQNQIFAFYFPLCRFWEMSIGSIIAISKIKITNYLFSNLLSLISFLIIFISCWMLNEESIFPGYWALIPTLSTTLIILTGEQSLVKKYILSNRIMVYIGQISYPLYLWHWPFLVFGRRLFPTGSNSIFSYPITMVFLSFIFTIITYYFIEKPIRFSKIKYTVKVLFLSMVIILALSILVNNEVQNYSFMQKKIQSMLSEQNEEFEGLKCRQQQTTKLNQTYIQVIKFQKQKALTKYQKSIIPEQQDYYLKDGKQIPNSSVNKCRKQTNLRKILQRYNNRMFITVQLQKRIDNTSKYYDLKIDQLQKFDILNEGSQNIVMLFGDSHARMISKRFFQLYQQSIYLKKQQRFPTVIFIGSSAKLFVPCDDFYFKIMDFIKVHKLKRVLFVQAWLMYLTYFIKDGPLQSNENFKQRCKKVSFNTKGQSKKDTESYVSMFISTMNQIKSWGIQVYASNINPNGRQFEPLSMFDAFGIIQNNIKPVRLSKFRAQQKQKIDMIQTALKNFNINIIDFSDNLCYNDVCQVFTPSGYPIFFDNDHFTEQYSQYWLSSIDFLTEF